MAWLSNWTYRKEITVTNASADYQTKILVGESSGATGEEVDCGGHVAADFDDLRFTAADGTTLLDYWIESITGSTPNGLATVWVQNNAGADATLYMYYGGTESAVSSGADTFDDFDDFEAGTNDWAIYNGGTISSSTTEEKHGTHSLEIIDDSGSASEGAYRSSLTIGSNKMITFWDRLTAARQIQFIIRDSGATIENIYFDTDGDIKGLGAGGVIQAYNINQWYKFDINLFSDTNKYKLWIDDVYKGEYNLFAAGSEVNALYNICKSTETATWYFDTFRVRKYTATEPTFAFGAEVESPWISPTGHVDPDTAWSNETNAYDENTATAATETPEASSWGSYLELTHASLSCDKVRFYAESTWGSATEISLDVYYSDGWHNIFEGAFADQAWVEKSIGSTQQVTAARVKFLGDNPISDYFYLYEFDFHEAEAPAGYPHSFGVIIF